MDTAPRACTLLAILVLAATACTNGPLLSEPSQVEQPQPEGIPEEVRDGPSPALCDVVASISARYDDPATTLGDEPEAEEVARLYRELSRDLDRAAQLLEDEEGATATARLARFHEAAAAFYRTQDEVPAAELADLTADAPALRSLEEQRAAGGPLGFPPAAWAEIEQRCDVAVDPPVGP